MGRWWVVHLAKCGHIAMRPGCRAIQTAIITWVMAECRQSCSSRRHRIYRGSTLITACMKVLAMADKGWKIDRGDADPHRINGVTTEATISGRDLELTEEVAVKTGGTATTQKFQVDVEWQHTVVLCYRKLLILKCLEIFQNCAKVPKLQQETSFVFIFWWQIQVQISRKSLLFHSKLEDNLKNVVWVLELLQILHKSSRSRQYKKFGSFKILKTLFY